MHMYTKHKMAGELLSEIASLINLVGDHSTKIPTKVSHLMKEFQINNRYSVTRSIVCKHCHAYTECEDNLNNKNCKNVNCQRVIPKANPYILNIGIKAQLRSIVIRNYKAIHDFRMKLTENNDGTITDGYDGKLLKRICRKNKEFIYGLVLNTDGCEIYKSDNNSLWPVILSCNFLPVNLRFKKRNLILAALYYDSKKPIFLEYFVQIAQEMNELTNNGMLINSCNYKFSIVNGSFDKPCKAAVHQIKQFNGYYACSVCKHKGELTSKGVRYTEPSKDYELRSHREMKNIMKKNAAKDVFVEETGIKGISGMIAFRDYNMVSSCYIDYMHMILLGVFKKMLLLFLKSTSKGKKYYIGPWAQRKLNNRLMSIRPTRFISRKPRSLKYISKYTASEFRNILLFYYTIFEGILEEKYYNHVELLSSTVFSLLKVNISRQDLVIAEENFKLFVAQFQLYYGKENMSINTHSLMHVVESVKNNGSLAVQSMFHFEMVNGLLKKYVVGTRKPMEQIATKYLIENVMYQRSEKKLPSPQIYVKQNYNLTDEEKKIFGEVLLNSNMDPSTLEIFAAYKNEKNLIMTSHKYTRAKKTLDYFIKTNNDKLGEISFFAKNGEKIYAIVNEFQVINPRKSHVFEVKQKGTFFCCDVEDIADKLVCLKFGFRQFTSPRPNSFEVN